MHWQARLLGAQQSHGSRWLLVGLSLYALPTLPPHDSKPKGKLMGFPSGRRELPEQPVRAAVDKGRDDPGRPRGRRRLLKKIERMEVMTVGPDDTLFIRLEYQISQNEAAYIQRLCVRAGFNSDHVLVFGAGVEIEVKRVSVEAESKLQALYDTTQWMANGTAS